MVTARKLGETLLTAPASVTVVSPETLARRNVTNANQLTGLVPGLVQSKNTGGGGGVVLRGLGTAGSVFSLESSVAEYVDGVYLGHNRDYVVPLYDLESLDVLMGTQSTLLGKNASVGAINIVTRRPNAEASASLALTHGFGIDSDRVEAVANAPVTSSVFVRAALLAANEGGAYENVFNNRASQRLRDLSGRVEVAYEPSDRTSLLLAYQHDDRLARGQNLQVISDPGGVLAARAVATGYSGFSTAPWTQNDAAEPLGGTPAGAPASDDQTTDRVNVIATAPVGRFVLTSQTAYVAWDSPRVVDLDFLPANLYSRSDHETNTVFSQELRIRSPAEERLSYLGGLYYYSNDWGLDRTTSAFAGAIKFPLTGYAHEVLKEQTRTSSVFGSARYLVIPRLSLTAGFRYTDERKSATLLRSGVGNIGGPTGSLPNIVPTDLPRKIANPIDGDIGLEFQASPQLLFYATYAKGSKSGGFQEGARTAAASPFASETAYSAEVGAKLNLRSRGYLTTALFDTEVHGFQTSTTSIIGVPPVAQSTIGNSNVRSRGAQAEGEFHVSPQLAVDGSLLYEDARFTRSFLPVAAKGDRLVRAPEWSGQIGIDFNRSLTPDLDLQMRPDVSFASEALQQFARLSPDSPPADAHALLDVKISLRSARGGWEIALLGSNLTNEAYFVFATTVSDGGTVIGQRANYGGYNAPRTVALQLTIRR